MPVMNELDRFHLAIEAIERAPELGEERPARQGLFHLILHRQFGEDLPEIES
ncbi:hypothetical protein LH464_22885 [Neorhizobium sp. T786]|uniref:hypothetical protein n=1 Tax=Pseudorhizobium xiangyangii TaxID=2883104 RepID=UPI001CFF8BC1|nr:hypothetical protein [Neorhizobium xiangyangii]MCB5205311.1 hypothetical protein [Neorhizobium xiangyangii]